MAVVIKYPTGLDYQQALYNTRLAFQDPALRGGEPVLDKLGMPKASSGNFASVFTVNGTDGQRWAVKCFTRHVPDLSLRYQQVSRALNRVTSPWKVEFKYLQEGVLCRGTWYPVLKMEWIEATSLLPFVQAHVTDSKTLAGLARKFGDLVADLSRHGIAHGDLQHGNILVTPSGELKLIDYDGMFVPGLDGLGASELGHANYQSPLRTRDNWGPDIDRFSSWVIYTSLTALAIDHRLWQTLHADGDETLLFHKSDFTDRGASRVRYALAHSSARRLREIANDIEFLWAPDLAAVPSLETWKAAAKQGSADWLRQHRATAETPVSKAGVTVASAGAGAGAGTGNGAGTVGQARPVGAAAWLTTHVPAAPHLEFSAPKASLRISCAVLLGLTVLCAVFLAGFTPLLVVTTWAVTFVNYRSSPQSRERRRCHKAFRERRSAAAKAGRKVSAMERAARRVVRAAEGRHSAAEKKAEGARLEEQREIAGVNDGLDREIKRLNAKISALHSQEDAEVGTALALLQRAHVYERLQATPVTTSGIRGIGPAIAARLDKYGIATAADIAGIKGAMIVRRDGAAVSPPGIGQGRASALYSWRLKVAAAAELTQPTALPWARRREIAQRYARQQEFLQSDQAAARGRANQELTDLRTKWAATHFGIAQELKLARERLEALRTDQDPEIAAARKQSETANWQRDFAKRELSRYRRIRYTRYLKTLVTAS